MRRESHKARERALRIGAKMEPPKAKGQGSLAQAPGSGLGGFTLLRGRLKEGQCAECAVVHDPAQPHNQQSLFWQYNFMEKQGRWPTWADAMAHCTPEIRGFWIKELATLGVIVPNKD